MKPGYFVTGTDTGVGKTEVSLGLMGRLQAEGRAVAGMKPVASGCRRTASGLLNEDALRLQAGSSIPLAYERVNPYAFEPPIAPHLAAASCGVQIRLSRILEAYGAIAAEAQWVVVEGVGGWLVPIGSRHTMADVAAALDLPVIMVVAIRLGCLNHALLTAAAIRDTGLPLAGWVANRIDPGCLGPEEIVESLRRRIGAPLVADVPFAPQTVAFDAVLWRIDPAQLLC